jgi:hypothetical protein
MQTQQRNNALAVDQHNPADGDFLCDLYEDILFELVAYSSC